MKKICLYDRFFAFHVHPNNISLIFFFVQELIYVKTLLLNRNAISFIALEAFSSLDQLESINLSNNRLELLDNRLFEQNNNLIDVNLSGNKFMHLPNEPILRSKSIKVTYLQSNCLFQFIE